MPATFSGIAPKSQLMPQTAPTEAAGVSKIVRFVHADVEGYTPTQRPSLVVTNPPYGERLDDPDVEASWSALGHFLRARCGGATAWVLSGNKALSRHLGLRTSLRVPVMNGPIECRWLRYEMHARD